MPLGQHESSNRPQTVTKGRIISDHDMTINTMFKTIRRKKEEEEIIAGYTVNTGGGPE